MIILLGASIIYIAICKGDQATKAAFFDTKPKISLKEDGPSDDIEMFSLVKEK